LEGFHQILNKGRNTKLYLNFRPHLYIFRNIFWVNNFSNGSEIMASQIVTHKKSQPFPFFRKLVEDFIFPLIFLLPFSGNGKQKMGKPLNPG